MNAPANLCGQCGAPRLPADRYCRKCGTTLPAGPPATAPAERCWPWSRVLLILVGLTGAFCLLRVGSDDDPGTPPDSPANPAAGPGVLSLFEAGAVLAETVIGAEGGVVESAGRVRVEFPPGACAAAEQIVIREGPGSAEVPVFFVESRAGGSLALNESVRVSLPVPAGLDGSELTVIQEVGPGLALGVPTSWDPAARTLSFETDHFSWFSWAKVQKSAYGTLGTGLVFIVLMGASAPITAGGWVLIGTVSLMFGNTAVSPAIQKLRNEWGLDQGIAVPGFQLCWARKGPHALPFDPPGDPLQVIGQQQPITFLFNGQGVLVGKSARSVEECQVKYPDLTGREIPHAIFVLAWELGKVRRYYDEAGYNPPQNVPVVIHAALGKDKWGDPNFGEWEEGPYGQIGYLHLDSNCVTSWQGEQSNRRRETLSHEYWHGVWENNRFAGPFEWANECFATVFESEIFPNCNSYLDLRQWNSAAVTLGYGLLGAGSDDTGGPEDPEKRGYYLWPWGKFLVHKYGHVKAREFLNGELTGDSLATEFRAFARALLSSDHVLPGLVPQSPAVYPAARKTGQGLQVTTGWGAYQLQDIMIVQGIGRGKLMDESRVSGPRPMSLNVLKVQPGPPPRIAGVTDPPLLVVRRVEPDDSEEFLVLPPQGKPAVVKNSQIVVGLGQAVVKPDLLKSVTDKGPPLPVAVLNAAETRRTTTTGQRENRLLVYYLEPPADVRVTLAEPFSGPGPVKVTFSWKNPNPGAVLQYTDCLNCLRPAVERIGSREIVVLDDVALSPSALSADVELPSGTEPVGLVAEDGGARDAAGKLLRSPVGPIQDDRVDIMACLLPADSLPSGLTEESRANDSVAGGPVEVDFAEQQLVGPEVDNSVPDDVYDFNPLLPPMNDQTPEQEEEWKKKAYKDYVFDDKGNPLHPKEGATSLPSRTRVVIRIGRPRMGLVADEAMLQAALEIITASHPELKPAGKDQFASGANGTPYALVYRRGRLVIGLFGGDSTPETRAAVDALRVRLETHLDRVGEPAGP